MATQALAVLGQDGWAEPVLDPAEERGALTGLLAGHLAARKRQLGDRINRPALARQGRAQQRGAGDRALIESRALCAALVGYPPGGLARIKTGPRRPAPVGADSWFDGLTDVGAALPRGSGANRTHTRPRGE